MYSTIIIREKGRLAADKTMRLLTHNMLRCNAKGVTSGYPLQIEIARDPATGEHVDGAVQVSEAEFNPEFLVRTLPKLEWAPFVEAARQIGVDGE